MGLAFPSAGSARPRRSLFLTAVLAATLGWAGCGSGRTIVVPPTRPIIVSSGERLRATPERMDSIVVWLEAETINIMEDPTFLIRAVPTARETLPWLNLTIEGDTASIQYDRAHPDITTVFDVYAHLHLMKSMGRLDEWLPEHADKEGFELEREIVARAADAWLLGRAAYGAPAYGPLDELIYAREAGYLDPFHTGRAWRGVRRGAGGLGRGQSRGTGGLPHLVPKGIRPRTPRTSRGSGRSGPVDQAGWTSQRAPTAGPLTALSTRRSTRPERANRLPEGRPPNTTKPFTFTIAERPSGDTARMRAPLSSPIEGASPDWSRRRRIRPPWGASMASSTRKVGWRMPWVDPIGSSLRREPVNQVRALASVPLELGRGADRVR